MWPRGTKHSLQGSEPHSPAAASLAVGDECTAAQGFIPNSLASSYTSGLVGQLFTPPSAPSNLSSISNSPARADAAAMSGNSAAKIGLDARAAELKEKLLKSRSQNQARINTAQSTPNPSRVNTHAPALTPSRSSSSLSGPSSERAKPSSTSFIPHEVPRQRAETSLPADANDIAALISSISSSASEIPGLSINSPNSDMPKMQAKQAAPTNGQASLPPKPHPKICIPLPAKRPVSAQNKQPQQPNSEVASKPHKARTNPFEDVSPEEGEITSTAQKNGEPTVLEKTVATPKRAAVAAPKINAAQSTVASNSRELAREKTEQAPTEPVARDGGNPPSTPTVVKPTPTAPKPAIASKPVSAPKPTPAPQPKIQAPTTAEVPKGVEGNSGGQAAVGGKATDHKTAPSSESSSDALARLLAHVPDIKDWLEITDYYNVDARTRKLDRFRRAKALAAEKLRIEEEERLLMEEEELEMGMHRSTFARMASAVPSAPAVPERASASLPTPTTPLVSETKEAAQAAPAKRAHDDSSHESRREKMPRLDEAPSRSKDTDNRARESERHSERSDPRDSRPDKADPRAQPNSRGSSPRHDYRRSPPSRPRDYSPHRQPRSGPRYRADYDDSIDSFGRYEPHRYDRYKGDGSHHLDTPRRRDSDQHVAHPIHVDLGRKGDTRFFIMKSFNEENVRRCMEDNIWTTQVQNGQTLTAAFAKCKNVILFFSINKSRAFQGYARMVSTPSPDTPRPKWVKGIHWDTSHPFRLEWLSKTSVEFFRIGHLKNPYNEGAPVLVGKDGQEIEEECGAELLREMEAYAENKAIPFEPRRESGYGGYGAKRYIKRESSPDRR